MQISDLLELHKFDLNYTYLNYNKKKNIRIAKYTVLHYGMALLTARAKQTKKVVFDNLLCQLIQNGCATNQSARWAKFYIYKAV